MNHDPYRILEKIASPQDLRKLAIEELPDLCSQIRYYLIDTLSKVGGHFASNLGVVELTVALHYVYQTPHDKLIWDTGHQIYPHKMITGRLNQLTTVRRWGGISGFPKREESPYDHYNTGHAGTAISQMLGEAIARDRLQQNYHCVSVIGDASISSGMAFEALNHGGHMKSNCLVIINDNDMSISKNVGALNQYMNKIITSQIYNKWMKRLYLFLIWFPIIGPSLQVFYRRFLRSLKGLIADGSFFDNLGFRYIGPVDGHNVVSLVEVLGKIKKMNGPLILHVLTQKGKGYSPAEENPIYYHSVGKFDSSKEENGKRVASTKINSLSAFVGEVLIELIEKNDKVIVLTPAMIEGSGLNRLAKIKPANLFDVGIAEQHSMTLAGALASSGMVPFLCIYSTFLNRAIDQLIQDVALMRLPVRLLVDRAGCVGADGETHQGLYDLGVLLSIPNIAVCVPRNTYEVLSSVYFMGQYDSSPIAIRFPKQQVSNLSFSSVTENIEIDKIKKAQNKLDIRGNGNDLAIITIGFMNDLAVHLQRELTYQCNLAVKIIELFWIRPFDYRLLDRALAPVKAFLFIEDSYIHSSASAFILQKIDYKQLAKYIHTFSFPCELIEHGQIHEVRNAYGFNIQEMMMLIKKKLMATKK